MNTYDVNLDGFFATEVGRVYGEIRDKILPYLRRERDGAKMLFATEHSFIDRLGAFASRLDTACATLKDLVRESKRDIGTQSFLDVLKRRNKTNGAVSDPSCGCDEFVDWVAGMDVATSSIRCALNKACERCGEAVKCAEEFDAVFATGIEFWETVLDFYLCDYVFEHADMKYKMKICRDFIKFFPQVTQKGNAFLTLFDAGKYDFKQNAELVLQWANEVYEQSQKRLQFYRHVKSMAESCGMASAFEEWKRAFDYSTKIAE